MKWATLFALAGKVLDWLLARSPKRGASEAERDIREVKEEVDEVDRPGRDAFLDRLRDDDRST